MASSVFFLLSILILSPTALSETCKTLKFKTPNKSFTNCADLPRLSAVLHYSFDAASSALSVAFTAAPSKPSGWVAWGIKPTADGMAGADALLAYENSSSSAVAVAAFHLQSYAKISPVSPLSINVSGVSGESSSDGQITIFATWRLPAGASSVNQVWQVGPAVITSGFPVKHAFQEDNLLAKSKLELTKADAALAPAARKNGAGEGLGRIGVFMGLVLGSFLLIVLLL